MSLPPAPGEESSIALALVNTEYAKGDELVAAGRDGRDGVVAARWLVAHGLAVDVPELSSREYWSLLELREAVRALFLARVAGAAPAPVSVREVNVAAAGVPHSLELSWPAAGEPGWARRPVRAGAFATALSLLATDAIALVSGPTAAELRECPAPGCVRLLVRDHRRRQWCSTRCGDRVRAHRHYHRTHAVTGADWAGE